MLGIIYIIIIALRVIIMAGILAGMIGMCDGDDCGFPVTITFVGLYFLLTYGEKILF